MARLPIDLSATLRAILVCLALICALAVSGCLADDRTGKQLGYNQEVWGRWSENPIWLGNTTTLIVAVIDHGRYTGSDDRNFTVALNLTEGLEAVNESSWTGIVESGETVYHDFSIRGTKVGSWNVNVKLLQNLDDCSGSLNVTRSEDGVEQSPQPKDFSGFPEKATRESCV